MRASLLGLISSALLLGACATSQFDRHFEAGRFLEAKRLFEGDSTLHADERALFRTGLMHALPASPLYDPDLAEEIFTRLVALKPKEPYRSEALFLNEFLSEIRRLEMTVRERELEVRRLEIEIEGAEERAHWLEMILERQEFQAKGLHELTERLERELRGTRSQLRTLREELDKLKEIDLKERRPAESGTTR